MSKIKAGTKVPDFSLPMTGGGTWSLKDAAGRKHLYAEEALEAAQRQ
jgi:peroxiredoxin